MVEDDVLFLHYILFPYFWDQLPVIENVLHVDPLKIFAIKSFSSDDKTPKFSLLKRLFEDVLLNSVYGDQSVDMNSLSLTDSVTSVLCLLVHSRVPVGIKENNAVGTCQINSNTSAPSAADEAEQFGR
jgi:hypothetical protein